MNKLTGILTLLALTLLSGTALAGDQYEEMVDSVASNPAVLVFTFIIWFVVIAFLIVAQWKLFVKAGEPGWASIVPIYNMIVMMKIAGQPEWWIVLLFIPFANIFAIIMMDIGLAKNFGRSGAFAAGLIFLPYIFMLILAFGSSRYSPVV